MKIFLDMDGVLADFNRAIHEAHGKTVAQPGSGKQPWDLDQFWGMTLNDFWAPSNNTKFWASIPRTPEANQIAEAAWGAVGTPNVCILTSPSLYDGCISAKRAWIAKYYPALADQMIFTSAKQFLAHPDTILIDDSDKNITRFATVGGQTVLVPRLWNTDFALADRTFSIVKERLEAINSRSIS